MVSAAVSLLVVAGASSVAQEPETLIAAEAADHVGEEATVCGKVAQAIFIENERRQQTYLNFGAAWPDQLFNIVIRGRHRPRFAAPPEQIYADRVLCVQGLIELVEGRPQIAVTRPEQITVVEAEAPNG